MSLLTWNTQGRNPTAYILNHSNQGFTAPFNVAPDWICLQETGDNGWQGKISAPIPCGWNPAPSFASYVEMTDIKINDTLYNGYMVNWQANLNGNNRCSMALLWKATLGAHAAMPISGWHSGFPSKRPVFWVTPAAGRRVGCIHAPSGGDATYVSNAITAIAGGAPAAGWILAGDFNLVSTGLLPLPANSGVTHSGGTTQTSGSNLDYLVYGGPAGGGAPYANCKSAENYVQSDHLQVRFV